MEIQVGKYRTRDGKTVDVTGVDPEFTWGVCGIMDGVEFGVGKGWRANGRFYTDTCDDPRDLIERIEEATPVDESAVEVECDGEFVPPEFVEVPDAGAIGVDFEPADYRPESSVIAENAAPADISGDGSEPDPCDYRESAETLAAALRNLLASLPDVVAVKTGDAATLARLALDGFEP